MDGSGNANFRTVNTYSDKNVKYEIEPLATQYKEDLIRNLNPVQFRFTDDPGKKHFGLIAQEVETLFQERVGIMGNDTGIKSLNYTELISPILSVLQNILNRLEAIEEKMK
jgi:hypothetical protein